MHTAHRLQAARAVLQRRAIWGLSTAALFVMGLAAWIVTQTQEVSLQTSLVLTSAAEVGVDQNRFDQSRRLGVLAATASWLHPAHGTGPLVLSRAADVSTLCTLFISHTAAVTCASFSPDDKRVVTAAQDRAARAWDAFWRSLVRPEKLIEEVCQRKLRGKVRLIHEADVREARIPDYERIGEDVCAGAAAVPNR